MTLTADSPSYQHIIQNVALLAISLLFFPLCSLVAVCSSVLAPFTSSSKKIHATRSQILHSSAEHQSRTVLVTGVGMSKGLAIARAFYRQGHNVIGADFEPFGIPVCGRFSKSLTKFHRLSKPVSRAEGSKMYVDGLLEIIRQEKVDLWVSCSGVASAIEDAEAAEHIEKLSGCKAIQFGVELTTKLHEKYAFIQETQRVGLNVPETHLIQSVEDAVLILHAEKPTKTEKRWVMKSVGLDDSVRGDVTLLPRPSVEETRRHVKRLRPSTSRPFVLQQYIESPEYCTHSIIVRGHVVAFAACPSADILMHYKALSPMSSLAKAMQTYTESYAANLGDVTGHFSIDFMLDDSDTSDLSQRLYPIECNPRAHTAVVLFENESKGMVDAYLTALENQPLSLEKPISPIMPSSTTVYYWIGHDIVTRVLLPVVFLLTGKGTLRDLQERFTEFFEHAIYWKDGTYEIWDAWVFWWMYSVYWPGMLVVAMFTRQWWSKCNVSTNKMFRC